MSSGAQAHRRSYLLRTRIDLESITVTDADILLADLGHTNPSQHTGHRTRSADLRDRPCRLSNL
ncbi:hypothetical protein ACFTWF_33930 [Rhodococcus sp. NPDC056960]|uniref:hypothetical protein n=1 Tax=Rhodococcus TaxID=1827 RepID=UPI00364355FA